MLDAIAPGIDVGTLHPALLHGIAPTMMADPRCTYWGSICQQHDDHIPQALGVGRTITTEMDDNKYDDITELNRHANVNHSEHTDQHDLTAAQIMSNLKRIQWPMPALILPSVCHEVRGQPLL